MNPDEVKTKVDSTPKPMSREPLTETQIFRGQQILRAPLNVATPTTVAEIVTVLRTLGLLK